MLIPITINASAAVIHMSRGEIAIIDVEDWAAQGKYNWTCSKKAACDLFYAERNTYRHGSFFLHRAVMNAKRGEIIDHKNGNGLDCRKSNLRRCTQAQNLRNRKPHRRKASGLKGVHRTASGKFAAAICLNYKQIHLGIFSDPLDAARAYNEAAKKYFGEFAYLNPVGL